MVRYDRCSGFLLGSVEGSGAAGASFSAATSGALLSDAGNNLTSIPTLVSDPTNLVSQRGGPGVAGPARQAGPAPRFCVLEVVEVQRGEEALQGRDLQPSSDIDQPVASRVHRHGEEVVHDHKTTIGATVRPTDKLSVKVEETFAESGTATKVGLAADMNEKLTLRGDYTGRRGQDHAVR